MFHDQHPQTVQRRSDFLFCWNSTPVTVVCHCIRCQCFILLPNVWIVFKIYFAILHNTVARNNVQHCIRLNKHLHYIWIVMLHIQVICFEHMAAWKRCDMRKVCGYIFEDHKLNVYQIFSQILRLYDDIYVGIYMPNLLKVYWNVSIQCKFLLCSCSEVCSDAFIICFLLTFLQHGCMLKS